MNERDYALRDAAMAAFVDSYFNARPQLPRDRLNELLVEAGFKAAWKPDQTERAERAEAELAKLREQEPVAYVKYKATGGNVGLSWMAIPTGVFYPREMEELYAAPVTAAPAVPDIHAIESQLTLAETEMLNAKAWSAGAQAKLHIDCAMTAIGCSRALLQFADHSVGVTEKGEKP